MNLTSLFLISDDITFPDAGSTFFVVFPRGGPFSLSTLPLSVSGLAPKSVKK
jgi:hypothetical protein